MRTLREDKSPVVFLALLLLALLIPLSGTANANHGDSVLDVEPETATRALGTAHTITATLQSCPAPGPPPMTCAPAPNTDAFPVNIDFENESGVNDTDGTTRTTPDATCNVTPGASSCTFSYTGTVVGNDLWRVWIDHDKVQTTDDSDTTEGRDEVMVPGSGHPSCPGAGGGIGSPAERDCTDVVQVTWSLAAGPPAALDCDDASGADRERETNPDGGPNSTETYTCNLTAASGGPPEDRVPGGSYDGYPVRGEVENGTNDPDTPDSASYDSPDYQCTTGSDGLCQINVTQLEGETGTAEICFFQTTTAANGGDASLCGTEPTGEGQLGDQSDTGNDLADQAEKTWQQRSSQGGGVDAEPENDTNNVGQDHSITAIVFDQFGDAFTAGNTVVNFEFFQGSPADGTDGNTPQTPDRTCTTAANSSSCFVTYSNTQAGVDLVCVWTNAQPTMSGNNTNGTCDGEALNDGDDAPGAPDSPEPVNDDQDVVRKEWRDPNAPVRLDCSPETDSNSISTSHTVTCTSFTGTGQTSPAGVEVDAEATSANDPDNQNSMTSPDFTCTTAANGQCSFTHGPGGTGTTSQVGTTTYRAWIDFDKDNSTVEADEFEGQTETAQAGSKPEPDDTDVVSKTWRDRPANLVMTPQTDTASTGTCNAFTIVVTDQTGTGVAGTIVDVEQRHDRANNQTANDEPTVSFCTPSSGPNPSGVDTSKGDLSPPSESPDNLGTAGGETTAVTDEQGRVTIGIKVQPGNGSDGSGNVAVTAFFEEQDNDDADSGEPRDDSTKTWIKGEGRTIDCQPKQASNPTGTQHTVTCTVLDRFGEPIEGETVTFTTGGVGTMTSPSTQSTTATGTVQATTTSQQGGSQSITATIEDDNQGAEPGEVDECDKAAGDPSGAPAGKCSDQVTKTWTAQPQPQCSDGTDNDGDGKTDHPADPGCDSPQDTSESPDPPQCSDGIDNDGDGKTDHPTDPGCDSPQDNDETDVVKPPKKIGSRIEDFDHGSPFTGDVESKKAKCERGRKVVVNKIGGRRIGTDKTSRSGAFRVTHSRPHGNGKFFAKVKKKTFVNNAGRTIICKAARSKTIRVR